MRACRFSSARPSGVPANMPTSALRYASNVSAIPTVSRRTFSRSAQSIASSMLSGLEIADGIASARTASGPSASAAIVAVSAESIPPERPSTASVNPFLRT